MLCYDVSCPLEQLDIFFLLNSYLEQYVSVTQLIYVQCEWKSLDTFTLIAEQTGQPKPARPDQFAQSDVMMKTPAPC